MANTTPDPTVEPKEILVGAETTSAHDLFIGWLNSLLNNYVVGFYDNAIRNVIDLSFIKEHNCFIQELYNVDGTAMIGFITIIPTNTSLNSIIMVHGLDGVPYLYNDTNGADIFQFNEVGRMVKFFENVTINLYNTSDYFNHVTPNHTECFITFEKFFGIKYPAIKVKSVGTNGIIGKGYMSVPYDGMEFSSYMANIIPLNELPQYIIENITEIDIELEVPVLKDLTIKYIVKSKKFIQVPQTEFTKQFFESTQLLGGLKFKLK